MKKKVLFLIPMVVVAVLLFMLRATGIKVHITVSFVGLVLLIAYTLATKKEWRNTALEILQRVCYGIALISGVVLMNVHGIAVVSIVHKISAVLFAILLIVCEIQKIIKK
jgi:Na+/H+ antiporter NhaD/arsenite permease-like protein